MQKNRFSMICTLTLGSLLSAAFMSTPVFAQNFTPPTGSKSVGSGKMSYYERDDVKGAIKHFHQSRQQLIEQARMHFNKKEFAEAVRAYQQAEDLTPNLPIPPGGPIQQKKVKLLTGYGEWGDALVALGKIEEAIVVYRNLIYTPCSLSALRQSDELSPIAVLPEGATDLQDARERFPQTTVQVWLANDPSVLSRYAQLLVVAGQTSEAILVYNQGLKNMAGETYEPLLQLGNISVNNFDRKRFVAGLHVMFAIGGSAEIWYGYYKHDGMSAVREVELNKAIKVKPDYTPALLAYANAIILQGKTAPIEKQRIAKQYLETAEMYARSGAQRDLARQMRNKYTSRLAP